ncbi:tRNA(Ser,Leu) C12 N-acetylase TAN1 [Paenibacillus phyllosphaerae]|uniref:tRNA(Ser,Leu) C12 N-acetylase TAN1 n=1 Tax=Paenibacillus phyllosphaerae TaxID=274593 RepID=A0A7W5B335_9BACL|nr:DUF2533 family protein [Paenibacillus phyllosphaerae]MBB3113535.1 tRNA(Ser,Leu) C12 N-acetylase TAN1 [Paenibacillus phyllosphaerae]
MLSAHEAITKHVSAQNRHLVHFAELDELREQAIERCSSLCKAGETFSVNEINEITAQINAHARKGISPTRVFVTEEMVREYAAKI